MCANVAGELLQRRTLTHTRCLLKTPLNNMVPAMNEIMIRVNRYGSNLNNHLACAQCYFLTFFGTPDREA